MSSAFETSLAQFSACRFSARSCPTTSHYDRTRLLRDEDEDEND